MSPALNAPNSCPSTTVAVTTETMKVESPKSGSKKRIAEAIEPKSYP
jgi:hypothetical protein